MFFEDDTIINTVKSVQMNFIVLYYTPLIPLILYFVFSLPAHIQIFSMIDHAKSGRSWQTTGIEHRDLLLSQGYSNKEYDPSIQSCFPMKAEKTQSIY